ncbi:uncharacterized protein EAE98_010541 [Botrytis deweyae]|uniref:Uncharacterized protein n=1 Tax=Botrytis deweyae TaxID=2478750 RepID=A0ABQ7I8M3_9HELO|nr:uncharacterized protein EAE98_010541 [Botrytis deweyae]KAF7916819.1 hypothetical protein EAE98_010541 [Botrytis deweyae]
MAPYIDKGKKRERILHRNGPTAQAQPSEESKQKKDKPKRKDFRIFSRYCAHLPISWERILDRVVIIAVIHCIYHRLPADTILQTGKMSKNFAARSAMAAKLRQERRNQRRLAKRAAWSSKDAGTDVDVGMKADEEGKDEDPNDNVDKAMNMLEDKNNKDKERNGDEGDGSRGAGSSWEIPIR